MSIQGNGNSLIAEAMGFSSTPSSPVCASSSLDERQFQIFLSIACVRELEEDLIFPSTWRFLK